jgi:HSP20 family protein
MKGGGVMATTALEKLEEKEGKALRRRWDPFDLLDDVRDEFTRFWGEPWPVLHRRPLRSLVKAGIVWHPRVDMYEKDDSLIVKADLPGLKKEDIQLSIEEGDLVLEGQRKTESEVKEENYYYSERSVGNFYRRMALPGEVTADKIEANFKDGVLEIKIPKPAEKKPQMKKIAVH